VTANTVICL